MMVAERGVMVVAKIKGFKFPMFISMFFFYLNSYKSHQISTVHIEPYLVRYLLIELELDS